MTARRIDLSRFSGVDVGKPSSVSMVDGEKDAPVPSIAVGSISGGDDSRNYPTLRDIDVQRSAITVLVDRLIPLDVPPPVCVVIY